MAEDELMQIETRVNAAQPAPWTETEVRSDEYSILAGDIAFIAHAREDVPALIAEVRRLREALKSIASYDEGAVVTGSFDEPYAAAKAREALEKA